MGKNDEFVVDGATIKCSMGDVSAKLNVTSNNTVLIKNKCAATEYDCTNANLIPPVATFGTCKPYKAVPPPGCLCTFVPTGPWKGTYFKEMIKGKEVIIGSSYLICGRPPGGKITITKSGQSGKNRSLIDKELLKCPKCGKSLNDDKHKYEKIPPGEYTGNGNKLGLNIIKKAYNGKFYEHPFFYRADLELINLSVPIDLEKIKIIKDELKKNKNNPRSGIEAHHIIPNATVKNNQLYKEIIHTLGYSINHNKNGVLLPDIMKVACSFRVPLHNSHHGAGLVLKKNTSFQEMIFPVYEPKQELVELTYVSKVNKSVAKIMSYVDLEDICCINEKNKIAIKFINRMDKISEVIFKRIKDFKWTITADGFDYKEDGIGCYDTNRIPDKKKKLTQKFNLNKNLGIGPKGASVLNFQARLYNNKEILNKIKSSFKCEHKIYSNPLKKFEYYIERDPKFLTPFVINSNASEK